MRHSLDKVRITAQLRHRIRRDLDQENLGTRNIGFTTFPEPRQRWRNFHTSEPCAQSFESNVALRVHLLSLSCLHDIGVDSEEFELTTSRSNEKRGPISIVLLHSKIIPSETIRRLHKFSA